MKTIRNWRTTWIFASALMLAASTPGEAHAGSRLVDLTGSGPAFSEGFTPGARQIRFSVTTLNNNNVGFDLIDIHSGSVIANGTIKDQGTRAGAATAHAGRTYRLRLRCQEPPWNMTKCQAYGNVEWSD